MKEFLSEGDREAKAVHFEQLQHREIGISDYTKEFLRLSKFARHIVQTEAAKINHFK